MSNNAFERLYKLQATIGKLVLDGKRDPSSVADHLQVIVDGSATTTPSKFEEFVDLGIITVPADYVHGTRLGTFKTQNEFKFPYGYHSAITDAKFSNPTRIIKPGDKFHVRVFRQVVGGSTTSEECMAFLATQNAVHTGAQGASLVFEQKRDQLPKGYWYVSFDEKESLPRIDGYHRVPYVCRHSGGGFEFDLGAFEDDWLVDDCLLCFCD